MATFDEMKAVLARYGQEHLLKFYPALSPPEQEELLGQLEQQDWAEIDALIERYVRQGVRAELPDSARIEPVPYFPAQPTEGQLAHYARAREHGETLIRQGRVAAMTVAGGQGTRLGWDGPKGTFPATPIRRKPLFQVFAEYLRKVETKFDTKVPWLVMTSPINHQATEAFFEEHGFFGLSPEQVTFFEQGTMPSISFDGKVLLADKGELALSPDGHGGSLRALYRSGVLNKLEAQGVSVISYFQVDNPNVKCIDPLFIGLHALEGAEMSSKMLAKARPDEKVGNFCLIDGRVSVIEYSDMPEELAQARTPDGELKFRAGSIAIHVLATSFVRRLNEAEGGFSLPWHRADKKVAHIDLESGERIEPAEPNAVKLETFVFDALPLAEKSVTLETDRVEEFAPIKNASGTDSPETSRKLQSLRAARWLQACGVKVPWKGDELGAVIELSHLTAIEPADLRGLELPRVIEAGSEVYL